MSIFQKFFANLSDSPEKSKPSNVLEVTFSLNTVYFTKGDVDQEEINSHAIFGGSISSLKGKRLKDMLEFEIDDRSLEDILGVSKLTSFKVDGRPVSGDYIFTGTETSVHLYASGDDKGTHA